MRNLLSLLFIVLFFSYSQREHSVDGIDYSVIVVSDSIVESDGKIIPVAVKIDYPNKNNQVSSNIRKLIIEDIQCWLLDFYIWSDHCVHDIPVELISDSLRSWIHNPNRDSFSKFLSIEVTSSGFEGISTIQRTSSWSSMMSEYSIDVKTGSLMVFEDVKNDPNFPALLLKQIREMKQDIIAHGIEYDESETTINFISLTVLPFNVNRLLCFCYIIDKYDNPYYITFPINELGLLADTQIRVFGKEGGIIAFRSSDTVKNIILDY